MPDYRSRDYAIQAGTQTVASFTSNHIIENFALQTDQAPFYWIAPDFFKGAIPERPSVNTMLDFSSTEDGSYVFKWTFTYFTLDMLEYWSDTFLNGGDPSAAVTVRTYDAFDTAVYLTCTIKKPRENNGTLTAATGGWFDVTYEFVGGSIIT